MNTKLAQSTPSCSLVGRKLCFVAFETETEGRLRAWIKRNKKRCRYETPV
jgi:hypothetical protein